MSGPSFPPDCCATRLRYAPTRRKPYRTKGFEARGNFKAREYEAKTSYAAGQKRTQSPAKSPAEVRESFRGR